MFKLPWQCHVACLQPSVSKEFEIASHVPEKKKKHAQRKLADIRAGRTSQPNLFIQNVERVINVDFIALILRDASNVIGGCETDRSSGFPLAFSGEALRISVREIFTASEDNTRPQWGRKSIWYPFLEHLWLRFAGNRLLDFPVVILWLDKDLRTVFLLGGIGNLWWQFTQQVRQKWDLHRLVETWFSPY